MKIELFNQYPSDAKIWLYTTDRILNTIELESIQKELDEYCNQWLSHGKSLHAKISFLSNILLAFVVDTTKVHASGCSIDDSIKFLKYLGQKYSVHFLDRNTCWIIDQNEMKKSSFFDLKNYNEEWMYNLSATHLGELREKPLIRVKEWLDQFQSV